ncbi:MAG TPA: M28 family peptidase [Gemmatimonadales bacterium]|nr:M28 family peptidase [Gemmatimonadales bacterium]
MTDYAMLFRELAVPRLVGTPNHQKVREVLKRELAARGFSVEEHAFSGRPARMLLGSPRVISGVNLVAQRSRTNVWLAAHYDSKGQPVSMLVRLIGFLSLIIGLVWLPFASGETWFVIPLAMGVSILLQNRVTDRSPGAVDNATALVAVFMTLDQLARDAAVGVVFPDAEEFGLVGARALARERAALFAGAAVINLDGLDDVGSVIAFLHRPGKVGDAVSRALHAMRARWLPVVVDGIALARVAGECVTILKGNAQTMAIVHRPEDSVSRVRLDGAATVAAGLARVLRAG